MLIAGVGNIFLADDGFGSEVARRLAREPLPAGVRVVDYGVGGVHLAYDLLDGYDVLVLVDTVSRGGPPGRVSVIEAGDDQAVGGPLDAHSMDPEAVLASVRRLGGRVPQTYVVGCEPADTTERIGLSDTVAAAVDAAASTVLDLVTARIAAGDENGSVAASPSGRER